MNTLNELTHQLSKEIQDKETRKRTRLDDEKIRFDYALTKILKDIWRNHFVHPKSECLMNRRSGAYSENAKYRDPNLTYKMAMAAFDGLIDLDMIYISKAKYILFTKSVLEDIKANYSSDRMINHFKTNSDYQHLVILRS